MKFSENTISQVSSIPPKALADMCGLKYKVGPNGGIDAFSYKNDEKTPSLKINVVNGATLFKDFSSGEKGGNAIHLYMSVFGLDFVGAVEEMAQKAGIPIEYEDSGQPTPKMESKSKLYSAMGWASSMYANNISEVMPYLESRGVTVELAQKWGLGYGKDDWQLLANCLDQNQKATAEKVGLITQSKKNGQFYDFLHDRLIFPIISGNKTIALAGRRMKDDNSPKYINTKNSPIYNKSKALYGFDNASRIGGPKCYVVEGYMDVIATDGISLPSVATCGTALTDEHIQKLYTRFDELVFCFDGDAAGIKAKRRAIDMVLPYIKDGKSASFITLPEGKDPADIVLEKRIAAFEETQSLSEAITDGIEALSEAEQMGFLSEFKNKLDSLEDSLQRLLLIHRVAERLNLNEGAISNLVGAS